MRRLALVLALLLVAGSASAATIRVEFGGAGTSSNHSGYFEYDSSETMTFNAVEGGWENSASRAAVIDGVLYSNSAVIFFVDPNSTEDCTSGTSCDWFGFDIYTDPADATRSGPSFANTGIVVYADFEAAAGTLPADGSVVTDLTPLSLWNALSGPGEAGWDAGEQEWMAADLSNSTGGVAPVATPEPGTAILAGLGLTGLGVFGRRRQR